ncbi:hypothetical protein RHS04_06592 [Rhizoctonia solani]|uniref:Uncharacterized protein n=1 Tax=Rhizoctonia solani TaxID=456999 RepID=A0A8H7LI87_9AGAM|nr:hypothetical protein RHS04_06592 [Rhizoctonia solani]
MGSVRPVEVTKRTAVRTGFSAVNVVCIIEGVFEVAADGARATSDGAVDEAGVLGAAVNVCLVATVSYPGVVGERIGVMAILFASGAPIVTSGGATHADAGTVDAICIIEGIFEGAAGGARTTSHLAVDEAEVLGTATEDACLLTTVSCLEDFDGCAGTGVLIFASGVPIATTEGATLGGTDADTPLGAGGRAFVLTGIFVAFEKLDAPS